MEQFLEMIKQADMLAGYTKKEYTIQYDEKLLKFILLQYQQVKAVMQLRLSSIRVQKL